MTDRTYARLVSEASLTGYERYVQGRIQRKLNKGEVPDIVMPERGPPRREGLRGHKYEYGHKITPKPLTGTTKRKPTDSNSDNSQVVKPNTEQTPSSSSSRSRATTGPTYYVRKPSAPSTAEASATLDLDETGSQASTVIESHSGSSNSEGESDSGEDENYHPCEDREKNQGEGSEDGEGEEYGGSEDGTGERRQGVHAGNGVFETDTATELAKIQDSVNNVDVGRTCSASNDDLAHETSAITPYNGYGAGFGYVNSSSDAPKTVFQHPFAPPISAAEHPFGNAEPIPMPFLPELSPEDALLLSASFPTTMAGDDGMDIDFELGDTGVLGLQLGTDIMSGGAGNLAQSTDFHVSPPSSFGPFPSPVPSPSVGLEFDVPGPTLAKETLPPLPDFAAPVSGQDRPLVKAKEAIQGSPNHIPQCLSTSCASPAPSVNTRSASINSASNPHSPSPSNTPLHSIPAPIPRRHGSVAGSPPGSRAVTPGIARAPLAGENIAPGASSGSSCVGTPPIHIRQHSTPVPPLASPHRNPTPILRRTSSKRLLPTRSVNIPTTPAVGSKFTSIQLLGAASTPSYHRSAPTTPLAQHVSLPRIRGLADSVPGSRLGSPIPSTPARQPNSRPRSASPRPRSTSPRSPNLPSLPITPARPSFNTGISDQQVFYSNPSPFNPDDSFSATEMEPLPSPAASRIRRDRTPPPLVRMGCSSQLTEEELVARSDGLLVTGEIPQEVHRVSPIPAPLRLARESATPAPRGSTLAPPTLVEFAKRRADEARSIQNARKATSGANTGSEQGARAIGSYEPATQSLIFLLRAGMQFDYLHHGPFILKEADRFARAKEFAQNLVTCDVDEIANEEVWKTMTTSNGQLRTAGQDEIKQEVARYYELEEGATEAIDDALTQDKFLYTGGVLTEENQFDLKLMVWVLAHLYFGTTRKLGVLFMDRLVQADDPADIEQLLVTVSDADETLVILDQSPEARRGPSIAAIAFAAVSIRHALERLKHPKQPTPSNHGKKGKKTQTDKGKGTGRGKGVPGPPRVPFNEGNYAAHWVRYVRALVCHPRLGALRNTFLDELKQKYMNGFTRYGRPRGTDHMW
ncbi:hypothetical protein RhiJN_25720 [Ceratobasidium sp. AG-Ba]|nr:hypothetical protein RhiJN_25720 [Ceratobasidium sp. AG-Ba]